MKKLVSIGVEPKMNQINRIVQPVGHTGLLFLPHDVGLFFFHSLELAAAEAIFLFLSSDASVSHGGTRPYSTETLFSGPYLAGLLLQVLLSRFVSLIATSHAGDGEGRERRWRVSRHQRWC